MAPTSSPPAAEAALSWAGLAKRTSAGSATCPRWIGRTTGRQLTNEIWPRRGSGRRGARLAATFGRTDIARNYKRSAGLWGKAFRLTVARIFHVGAVPCHWTDRAGRH